MTLNDVRVKHPSNVNISARTAIDSPQLTHIEFREGSNPLRLWDYKCHNANAGSSLFKQERQRTLLCIMLLTLNFTQYFFLNLPAIRLIPKEGMSHIIATVKQQHYGKLL